MSLKSNQNIQTFPKCKVCGAGIFLSEEAFIQHFSQNHLIPEDDNQCNDDFDKVESRKSSTESKETEIELFENEPILENEENFENEKIDDTSKSISNGNIGREFNFIKDNKILQLKIQRCKIYECEVCSKIFCNMKNLEAHKFSVHDMEEIVKKITVKDDSVSINDMNNKTYTNKIPNLGQDPKVLLNMHIENIISIEQQNVVPIRKSVNNEAVFDDILDLDNIDNHVIEPIVQVKKSKNQKIIEKKIVKKIIKNWPI